MLDAFGWVVHPLAGFALALWASVIFSPRGKHAAQVGRAAAVIVLLAVLGADWVVHPAAGMLLGFLGSRAFHRWQTNWPALLVGLIGGVFFMALGATWLMFPLFVMGMIWLSTAAFTANAGHRTPGLDAGETVSALPEHAGGLPFGTFGEREALPVPGGKRRGHTQPPPPQAPNPAPDALAAYVRDERLPGEARAQIAALDLRTREALTHLENLGQQGSEAAYLARAVRQEYAPTAVQAYLRLPPTLANVTPLQDGKTGRDLLREQLDLLLNAVQDILGTALRSGGQDLLTHQRFLEEKFRKARGDLEV